MKTNTDAQDADFQKTMAAYRRTMSDRHTRVLAAREAGEAALRRLLPIARHFTGQGERVARILLGLYNGRRFPLDLTNLRSLDDAILDDVLAVLRMDANAYQEVHRYFENGGAIFEQMAKDWGFEQKGEV